MYAIRSYYDFEPGTRWSYSNTGYYLLSLVIERISGMAFGNYMRERVFEPLQLENTFVAGYGPPGMALVQGCRPGEGHPQVRADHPGTLPQRRLAGDGAAAG